MGGCLIEITSNVDVLLVPLGPGLVRLTSDDTFCDAEID